MTDLTKPLRNRTTKNPVYLTSKKLDGKLLGVEEDLGTPCGGVTVVHYENRLFSPDDLENIPEIIRHERWVNVWSGGTVEWPTERQALSYAADHNFGYPIHITFYHDPETGKPWAEVDPKE